MHLGRNAASTHNRARLQLTLGLMGLLLLSLACSPSTSPPLNVLLISIDTLRADHLSYNGYPRLTSPHIDGLASRSVVFASAFSASPKTGPSMASLFTGNYPQRHGVTRNKLSVPGGNRLLAELLDERYARAAFVSNPTLARSRGFSAGFQLFELVEGTSQVSDRAIRWLATQGDSPFFLWLHFIDPHGPYRPPPGQDEMFVGDEHYDPSRRVALDYIPTPGRNRNHVLGAVPRYQRLGQMDLVGYYVAQYDAEIRFVDEQVGRVLRHLEAVGLTGRTLVVLTADHGESLGEHDYYFEHGMLVNEGSIHVPLIVRHPRLETHRRIEALVQTVDVMPTLLAQLGLEIPAGIDGVDLSRLLWHGDDAGPVHEFVYSCTPYPDTYPTFFETARTRRGKWVLSADGDLEYFDLLENPGEDRDRASAFPSEVREKWRRTLGAFGPRAEQPEPAPSLSRELKERLEALGYADE